MALNRTGRRSLFGKRNGPAAPNPLSIAWRMLIVSSMVFSIVAGLFGDPKVAQAALGAVTINSLNGSSLPTSVNVSVGSSISVAITVNTSGVSGNTLGSVQYRFVPTSGSTSNYNWTCVDVPDDTTGTRTATFNAVAYLTGSVKLEVRAFTNNTCSSGQSSGTASTSSPTTITVNPVTPADNPHVELQCGMDFIMILDESGSIKGDGIGNNIQNTVRNAARSFVSGLVGTDSYLTVVEFNSLARRAEIRSINNNNSSFTTNYQLITNDFATNATRFEDYINGGGGGTDGNRGYDPANYTNWEQALQTAYSVGARPGSGRTPYVIFFTDGNPTAAGTPVRWETEDLFTASVYAAVPSANRIKNNLGSHIFVVALNNPSVVESNVQAVSGPTRYGAGVGQSTNLGVADYIILGQNDDLGEIFRELVTQTCGVNVTVNKKVDNNNDGDTTDPGEGNASGWTFTGDVDVPASGGNNYTWRSPQTPGTPNPGQIASGATNASGNVTFGWIYNPVSGNSPSKIVITETPTGPQNTQYRMTSFVCQTPNGTVYGDITNKNVTLDNLPKSSASSCVVVNTRKPIIQPQCLSAESLAPSHPDSNDPYIQGRVRNNDTVAQANNWKMVFEMISPALGQMEFENRWQASLPTTCSLSNNNRTATCTLNSGILPANTNWDVKMYVDQLVPGNFNAEVSINAINESGEVAQNLIAPDSCTATTPVTLASFKAVRGGDMVRFEWTTATELGNAGFNLYAETNGERVRLNEQLIASPVGDSLEPQGYTFETPAPSDTFYIEDVDVLGRTQLRGPFAEGTEYGARPEMEPVDWQSIRNERAAKARERAAADTAATNAILDRADRPAADNGKLADQYDFSEVDDVVPALFLPTIGSTGSRPTSISSAPEAPSLPIAKLNVRKTGLYQVTFEQLRDAGFNVKGIRSETLALTHNGVPVPIRVYSSAAFGPGAFIQFYGEALDTLYTDTNVYVLQSNRSLARRIGVSDLSQPENAEPAEFYMATVEVDNNRLYSFSSPTEDPWYDTRMLVYKTPGTWSFGLTVDHYVAGAAPAQLSVGLFGGTDWPGDGPDHRVTVAFNDAAELTQASFDGLVYRVLEATLPEGTLLEGTNTLKVTLTGDTGVDYDVTNLDKYSVTYPRAFVAGEDGLRFTAAGAIFRVRGLSTDSVEIYRLSGDSVVRIVGYSATQQGDGTWDVTFTGAEQEATYLVVPVSKIMAPSLVAVTNNDITSGSADYLMISHPDFVSDLSPLAEFHRSRGLNVRIVDVRDVYNQFGHGIFDPKAIHEYIKYAAQNMGVRIVLLVGGDTYDYRGYTATGGVSFIPSLYAATDAIVRFAPVDPLFADVNGDQVPDVQIGRFPVRTSAELAAMINKTLTYASKSYGSTAVFAADKDFSIDSNLIASQLPEGWSTELAYIDLEGSAAAARAKLVAKIEEGVALASYVGHSSATMWSYSQLLTSNQVAALQNAGKPTVVTQWGCWNTYYVSPAYNSMGHKFLVSGENGAAAVMGATTLTLARSEKQLGTLLTPQLTAPGTTIGEAMLSAKQQLAASNPELKDVILGWTLLGDPALQVTPQ